MSIELYRMIMDRLEIYSLWCQMNLFRVAISRDLYSFSQSLWLLRLCKCLIKQSKDAFDDMKASVWIKGQLIWYCTWRLCVFLYRWRSKNSFFYKKKAGYLYARCAIYIHDSAINTEWQWISSLFVFNRLTGKLLFYWLVKSKFEKELTATDKSHSKGPSFHNLSAASFLVNILKHG